MNTSVPYVRWFAPLFALAFAACSDDGGIPNGVDAGVDTGGDVSVPDSCEGVPVAAQTDVPCGPGATCVEGAHCAAPEGEEDASCLQGCRPGVCESVCSGGTVCTPFSHDSTTGVCVTPPEGPRAAYETCSDEVGSCAPGLSCIVNSDTASEGVCLPACVESACPEAEGKAGLCLVTLDPAEPASLCLPVCTGGNSEGECPSGLTCQAHGDTSVCAFPQPS